MAPSIHPLPAELPRRRFTAQEVARMVEAGILTDAEHVELLDGELIVTPPQGPEHASLTESLGELLRRAYAETYRVRTAMPLNLGESTNPEPDLVVAPGSVGTFRKRHPTGSEALLVVEVTQSTHTLDHAKANRYARAGVPTYWIVDVPARRVEIFTEPLMEEARYVEQRTLSGVQTVTPPETNAAWEVADLFTGL